MSRIPPSIYKLLRRPQMCSETYPNQMRRCLSNWRLRRLAVGLQCLSNLGFQCLSNWRLRRVAAGFPTSAQLPPAASNCRVSNVCATGARGIAV